MPLYYALMGLLIYYYLPEVFEYKLNTHDITVFKMITIASFAIPLIVINKYIQITRLTIIFSFYYFIQIILLMVNGWNNLFLFQEINYFCTAILSLIFLNNSIINVEKINNILFNANLVIIVILTFQLIFDVRLESVFRPHFMIQLYILLLLTGIEISRKNIFLLIFLSMIFFILSYQSRIALFCIFILGIYSYGFFLVVIASSILFFLSYSGELITRIKEMGVNDFGREYIYKCVFDNANEIGFITPIASSLSECNIFGYTHSSHIEALLNFGIIFFVIALLLILIDIFKSLLKPDKTVLIGYLLFMIYGCFEGGLEWVYLFIIGKYLSAISSPSTNKNITF